MSQISTEWRECSIMTLLTIHWVPVQDKGSKILCVKFGTMKITPSDCLHQEYLTIYLGSTSDCRKLKLPLVRLFWRWGADAGSLSLLIIFLILCKYYYKNPAYGRQRISRPMRKAGPIQFWRFF